MAGKRIYHLYLAVYDNSRSAALGRIHWGLLIGPKAEDPSSCRKTHGLFHAVYGAGHWKFEMLTFECVRSRSMLGRILLGEIKEDQMISVDAILQNESRLETDNPRWNCWSWVEGALIDLQGTNLVKWKAGNIDLQHLQTYGRQFSEEITAAGLDVGNGIPATVIYPGKVPCVYSVFLLYDMLNAASEFRKRSSGEFSATTYQDVDTECVIQ
ncbi:hypothetical protein TRAPUB_4789 [Trametes pubescens]|uniref:Uncharacterized protein n=1 Tax=Trametes pubescens TaxID=154538 RepID=A0A1M2VAB4_TRAPU|nr:hypothetical protein TRAPUB_4789 [Trametes pubescens]